ncbi:DUF3192 domain-containing protein [Aestuariibacter halophilus]|uniref:DUF3192 domain-containing protein n=1 Tax=Fluctibacter halophilus TaxID=226011 RepID=A0ABS8G2M2_9ALTE|nr:DUF3192 domain-containing protein [Aestuariibacter halophilus]MCC2614832.1 DUF3192 domain-containing protein [Aestuariibacter halophilus]
MNSKIVKRIGLGVCLYAAFVFGVVTLYPDKPEDMDWKDREEYNKVQIAKLELGVSRQEILALLGSPDISEAKISDDQTVQVMFYRTQHKKSDGITTQNECTPLLFEGDKLVAWGDGAYQSYLEN